MAAESITGVLAALGVVLILTKLARLVRLNLCRLCVCGWVAIASVGCSHWWGGPAVWEYFLAAGGVVGLVGLWREEADAAV